MHPDSLSHIDYEPALLTALFETGGARARAETIQRVGEILRHRFGEPDFNKRSDGRLNWEYRVDWVKNKLVKEGLHGAESDARLLEVDRPRIQRGVERCSVFVYLIIRRSLGRR